MEPCRGKLSRMSWGWGRKPWLRALPATALVLAGGAVHAGQPPSQEDLAAELMSVLNTPVVGASKRAQRAIESPQAVEVITADQIREGGAFRMADVLRMATSLQVCDMDAQGAFVTFRGVAPSGNANTVQILVDGVPLFNTAGVAIDLNGLPVPVEAIEKVEIVRGPSSTLYGANAQTGIIAITTRRAGDGVAGSVRAGAANDGMFRQQGFFSMGRGALSLTASAAGDSNRNLGQPLDIMGKPGQSQALDDAAHGAQYFLRPEAALAGGGKVWLAYGHGTAGHVDQIGYTPTGVPAAQLTNLTTIREIVQIGWSQPWSPTLASDLRYNQKTCRQDLGAVTPLSGSAPDQGEENTQLLFDRIRQVTLQTNWDPSERVHLVTGVDGSAIETGQSTLMGLPQAETYHSTGGFLSLDWQLGALALSGGARAANESLGGSSVSPRLSAVWILDQSSVLRAGYFTSTRSPTAVEKNASLSTVGFLPYDLVRNPGLQSEKAEDYEIGYRKQWDRVTLDLTGFRMELKRIIVLRPDNRAGQQKATVSYQNGSGTHTDSGFEIALSAELAPGLQAGWNASTSRLKDPIYGLDQQADYCPKGQTGAWLRCRRGIWFGSFAVQEMGSYTVVVPDGTDRQTISATTHAQFNTGLEPLRGLSLSVYGFNALKGTQEVSNLGLLNLNAKRYTRREMGVQAKYSF